MGSERGNNTEISRRALLARAGAGSLLTVGALGAVSPAAASERRGPGATVEPREFQADVRRYPEVERATIRLNENGTVSKTLEITPDAATDAGPSHSRRPNSTGGATGTGAKYALNLRASSTAAEAASAGDAVGPQGFSAAVQKRERPGRVQPPGTQRQPADGSSTDVTAPDVSATDVSSTDVSSTDISAPTDGSTDASSQDGSTIDASSTGASPTDDATGGLPPEPDLGYADAVYYAHTKSQECGPLARTNVSDYGYVYDDHRETVDGDACEGATWDSTFELFCSIQEPIVGHCEVPDAFNTDWHTRGAVGRGRFAGSVFSCSNFPAIVDTVVSAHTVEVSGGSVTYEASHGILYGDLDWSDYDFDQNGIANAVVDVGVLATPLGGVVRSFSWALAAWLLADEADVVRA